MNKSEINWTQNDKLSTKQCWK